MKASWRELIELLRKHQQEFLTAARSLKKSDREKQGICGTWSPKQVVAHISGWDKEVIRQFKLFRDGLDKAVEHDIDEFNAKSVRERENLSWQETVDELEKLQKEFYQQANAVSVNEISQNKEYKEWVKVQIEHYTHHTKQLREWL